MRFQIAHLRVLTEREICFMPYGNCHTLHSKRGTMDEQILLVSRSSPAEVVRSVSQGNRLRLTIIASTATARDQICRGRGPGSHFGQAKLASHISKALASKEGKKT